MCVFRDKKQIYLSMDACARQQVNNKIKYYSRNGYKNNGGQI